MFDVEAQELTRSDLRDTFAIRISLYFCLQLHKIEHSFTCSWTRITDPQKLRTERGIKAVRILGLELRIGVVVLSKGRLTFHT